MRLRMRKSIFPLASPIFDPSSILRYTCPNEQLYLIRRWLSQWSDLRGQEPSDRDPYQRDRAHHRLHRSIEETFHYLGHLDSPAMTETDAFMLQTIQEIQETRPHASAV